MSIKAPLHRGGHEGAKSRLREGDGVEGWDYARSKLR